jgi:hypothetical protein
MRTASPRNIKDDFVSSLQDIENTFQGVSGTALPVTSKNLVSEYAFLGVSILLEGFISDLFVAYINIDNSSFLANLKQQMKIDTSDEYAKRAKSFASVDIASHPILDQIRSILDPRDWNVTFPTLDDLKEKSGKWLSDPYKTYFLGLSPNNFAFIEVTKAIRNYLAHRSGAAHSLMQNALLNPDLTHGLGRAANEVHKVGSFLDSRPVIGGQRRLELYLVELRTIANLLCP